MKTITFFLILLLAAVAASGQIDTINAKNHKLKLDNLKESKTEYLVYFTDSVLNRKGTGDIWQRAVKFGTRNNHSIVEFDWQWLRHDSLLADITNICDRNTLAPIFHKAVYKKGGVYAFNYENDYMIPADTVPNNQALKLKKIPLNIPIISWEEDMETYALLPIHKVGQTFDIAFFDPNETEATYHRYKVIGKESLELNNDTKENCWLLRIDYDKSSYATFWLTEKSKEVVKMKEYYNGSYRFKIRLY